MGNEASSENDRRARQRMLSYKQFVRDLHNLNSLCDGSFIDPRTGCRLSFEAVTNLSHHELLPLLWKQEGRILVIVHRRQAEQAVASMSEDGGAANAMERKADASLAPAKALTVLQFYHLFLYASHNAPIMQQARARLKKMQQREQLSVDSSDRGSSIAAMDGDDSRVCSICLSADVEVALSCLHAFCSACIEDWHAHDQSCPLCRAKADVNGAEGDVWLMDGGSETELREVCDTINSFPHHFLLDKPDFVE